MNRLGSEQSPYLLQHKDNPVHWYPWGEEAFREATVSGKPVFLSIGYATCHWCHVMEHESFVDPEVAAVLNEHFISIKVDREERPDIDGIYMHVCQLLTGHGGWPLTVILTPEKKPFFAGTYFPKHSRGGRMGILDLLMQMQKAWKTRRADIEHHAADLTAELNQDSAGSPASADEKTLITAGIRGLAGRFDASFGGFSGAPKFPSPQNLLFLARCAAKDEKLISMVTHTIRQMRLGGIFDHVGGGFHRYSTDRIWLVPHFEKMLYDQAMMVSACLEAGQASGDGLMFSIADEVLAYVLRDLTSEEGGFFSGEDADSEGEEGKFYLWEKKEIESLLGDSFRGFAGLFPLEEGGNYHDEVHGGETGKNILHLRKFPGDESEKTAAHLRILFAERKKRIHPLKDDKVLTDWNGLMIRALADASRIRAREEYLTAAAKATDFIFGRLHKDGELLHRYRGGHAAIRGMLDDYSFLISGLISLYEAGDGSRRIRQALELLTTCEKLFLQPSGVFIHSAADDLIARRTETYDGAYPCGNSMMLENYFRLFHASGETRFRDAAEKLRDAIFKSGEAVSAHAMSLAALAAAGHPSVAIFAPDAESARGMLGDISPFLPAGGSLQIRIRGDEDFVPPFLNRSSDQKEFQICRDFSCSLPVKSAEEALKLLRD